MSEQRRNIGFMVIDREVRTLKSDEYWDKEIRGISKIETSSFETADKVVREFRNQILLLVVFVTKETPEFARFILDLDDIPFVLIMKAGQARDQLGKLLEGKNAVNPFDVILESWLRKIEATLPEPL